MRRFTEKHPLTRKLRGLERYLEENKITVEWGAFGLRLTDETTGVAADVRELEAGFGATELPSVVECALFQEDEEL